MRDPVKNFAKVTVSTTYDASATSIALTAGHGALLPAPATAGAYNLVWWNSTDYADPADDPNVEIVRVTARSTDTLTVTRAQEGTSASTKNTASKTYKMILALTKDVMDDVDSEGIAATGSLSDGSKVIVRSDGTVEVISGRVQANGTATNTPTTNVGSTACCYDSVSGKVLVVYQTDSGNTGVAKATVGTVSGTSISFGSDVSMTAFFTNTIACCFTGIGSSKVLITYKNFNSSQRGEIICGTISGTSISFGTAVTLESVKTNSIGLDWDSGNSKGLVVFYDATNTRIRAQVVTVSGTTITVNTAVTVASVGANLIRCVYTASNTFVIAYYDTTNTAGKAVVQTVSGTTSSSGTIATFKSGNVSNSIDLVFTASAKVAIVYRIEADTSGAIVIGTVSGTSISFGSETVFATGTITNVAVGYDSTNGQVQVGYYDGTNGKAIESAIVETGITFSASAITTTASKTPIFGGVLYIGSSKFVHVFSTCSAQVVGSFYSNLSTTNFLGISNGAYTTGQIAKIFKAGDIADNLSGLTAGLKYYVLEDGTLSTSDTSKPYLGLALTTTKLVVKG